MILVKIKPDSANNYGDIWTIPSYIFEDLYFQIKFLIICSGKCVVTLFKLRVKLIKSRSPDYASPLPKIE